MKTAEEILNDNHLKDTESIRSISTPHFPLAFKNTALKSMEEYAQQRVEEATKKMKEAVRVAMHGGVIKYGVRVQASANDICSIIDQQSKAPTV